MATNAKKISTTLLWVGISVVVLLLGAGAALMVIDPGLARHVPGGGVVADLFGAAQPPLPAPPPGMGPRGAGNRGAANGGAQNRQGGSDQVRTHMVRDGENLWAIARNGKLVDTPWEWRTIVTQNQSKIDYAFISEDTGDWKVILKKGQQLTVAPEPQPPPGGAVKKRFALQLVSVPGTRRDKAVEIVQTLLNGGTFAYFYRAEVAGKAVYRVRAGFFDTREQAAQVARHLGEQAALRKILPGEFLVVVPSDQELRGELFDFGIQRTRPWVVEFPPRASHDEAIEMLKKVGAPGRFSYIAQRRDQATGVFSYRIRIGFFPSRDLADAFRVGQGADGGWAAARAVSLTSFPETLPGQSMKMKPPRS